MLKSPNLIRFAEKFDDSLIDILWIGEAEVMAKTQLAERLSSYQPRVIHSTSQPHTCIEPILTHNNPGKPHAPLQYNPSLLRVHSYRTKGSRCGNVTVKCLAERSWFTIEVIGKPVTTT